jgi:hypothetical protein
MMSNLPRLLPGRRTGSEQLRDGPRGLRGIPNVLAGEIAEGFRSALEQIQSVFGDLRQRAAVSDSAVTQLAGQAAPRGRIRDDG